MTKRRKQTWILLGTLLILALALIPVPVSPTNSDKARVVPYAVTSLVQNRRVLTDRGYCRLGDCGWVEEQDQLYFENVLGIPDSVFLKDGLKPAPKDKRLEVGNGNVLLWFGMQDDEGNPTDNIRFMYVFGSFGGQIYEIRIYRSLLLDYIVFVHVASI